MLETIDKKFELIKSQFKQNNSATIMINKAYELAKDLHKDQKRKSGEMYINHPVDVALILAKLGFDENVISAALLHDVVEDCGYTLDSIKQEFNKDVAEMVDCVSEIDEAKFVFDKEDLYEDVNFEKASIEERSFKKLISIGKKNPLGFCIKFADRLNNLRTINIFEYSKQLEKVKETEKWIIPIAQILHTEYFYRAIKNECFKIKHKYDGQEFFEHYSNYHNSNYKNIQTMQIKFQELFANTPVSQVKIKNIREYKVYEDLQKIFKNINISKVSQGQILKVANYNVYLLYNGNKISNNIVGEILSKINKNLHDIKVIDARIGNFTQKPYYLLEDNFKNKFNLYIESVAEYVKQRNGTMEGQDIDYFDDDNLDNLNVELIKVFTRSGESRFMPKGCTVLDFAFKIHKDIGFGFKYAIINGSKTKNPPYTKVYEGDKIEIVVDKTVDDETANNAELKWLAYVNTDFAKKCLIKYFEKHIKP